MDRELVTAVLRVLSAVSDCCERSAEDIDLLRKSSLPSEWNLDPDDLASSIIYRIIDSPHPVPPLGKD